jgi:peptidoglycan/LPS O-acetylase OafA/YrhL
MTRRIPSLDGLRAMAILLVVFCHVQVFLHPLSGRAARFCTDMAWSGVYLFFVLSGYLIGSLVSSEIARTGRLDVKAFWVRRALRTWPLYFLALAANYWHMTQSGTPAEPPLGAFLTFTQIYFKNSYFIESWSLSIEEQFYLLLPLFFLVVLRFGGRKAVAVACVAVIAASWLVRMRTGYRLHPATTFDGLFLGVLIAELHLTRNRTFEFLRRFPDLLFAAGTLLLYVIFTRYGVGGLRQFQGLLAIAFALMLIAALNPAGLGSRILAAKVWKPIALSSYSTYLSHMFVMRGLAGEMPIAVNDGAGNSWGIFAVAVVVTLAAGWVVYAVIEKPGLRLREVIAPTGKKEISVPLSASVSLW